MALVPSSCLISPPLPSFRSTLSTPVPSPDLQHIRRAVACGLVVAEHCADVPQLHRDRPAVWPRIGHLRTQQRACGCKRVPGVEKRCEPEEGRV
eukprot:363083-Chlamydomonas_euryale.AAC.4